MAYELSIPQKRAITERTGNLLVAAGAGSGKTTVLVERVLTRILTDEQADIDRLLVLTFTNAAAAEMRQRIEEGLISRLQKRPGDARLTRQLALLQQAPITTIHSFCLDVVRRNFYRLGLDAGFRIPSETERAILQEETLADFLEDEYAKEDERLSALADAYGGRHGDAALAQLIVNLYRFSRSQPHPTAWLAEVGAAFSLEKGLNDYLWSDFLLQELQYELALARHNLDLARTVAMTEGVPEAWLDITVREIATFNALLTERHTLESFLDGLSGLAFALLPQRPQGDSEAKKEFRRLREKSKKALRELQNRYSRRSTATMARDMQQLAPLMERLSSLVHDYEVALSIAKRKRNLLDFDDMEHFCLALLEDPASGVAAELSANFDEILVDEYQDINAVQESILQLVARQDNFFAVGDVKQSIYRFRLADPGLFLEKYRQYGQGLGGQRIDLNCNYRSEGGLIDAVNFIFRQLMSGESAELAYDAEAELQAGRAATGAKPEFWLVEQTAGEAEATAEAETGDGQEAAKPADGEEDAPAPTEDLDTLEEHALAAEARLVGKRALALKEEGYGFSDMVVLLRATKNREQVFVEQLTQLGVPAVAAGRPDYLETPEIGLMLSLLAIIDNPLQEIELAAVLRSPLFDFTLDELVELRFAAGAESGVWQGMHTLAGQEGALPAKVRDFLCRLEAWRDSLQHRSISELIWAIYRETGFYHLVGALPQGQQRQQNFLLLYQRAREYEASSFRGLFRFLLFLEDSRGKGGGSDGQLAEQGEAVRIMSIHRSKGLEFPVVFLAGLGSSFSLIDERQDIIWHRELGLGPKIVDRKKRLKFPSLAHDAVARQLHRETLAEEMRVLYVALTRARERLILTGSVRDANKTIQAWYQAVAQQGPVLPGKALLRDKRPLDWLGKALLRHPDAGLLRQRCAEVVAAAGKLTTLTAGHGWEFHIVPKGSLRPSQVMPEENMAALFSGQLLLPSPAAQQVKATLSYRYPYAAFATYPAKWTVSELNRLAYAPPEPQQEQAAPLFPDLLMPRPAVARRNHGPHHHEEATWRGDAHHKVLQHLDFKQAGSLREIVQQMGQLVGRGVVTDEEANAVDTEKILRFCQSSLGRRLAQAEHCLRETTFTYALPAQELLPGAPPGDKLVLQGMIDAAFEEAGGWVLLDYKTGGQGRGLQELHDRYQTQMMYYTRALTEIWRTPVKEIWLYFVDLEQAVPMR